jgi:hypothetical protein
VRRQPESSAAVRLEARQSGASVTGSARGRRVPAAATGPVRLLTLLVVAATALLLIATPALGAQTHPYTGVSFGPDGVGGSQSFASVGSIAVDPVNGDVYVYDAEAGSIYKFDSAGAPTNFSSSGTNVITGVGGVGYFAGNQVALAPAGAPGGTAGDIYVANAGQSVNVYAASGAFLGEVSQGGTTCGVATDPSGNFYASLNFSTVNKYTPDANPPTTANKEVGTVGHDICNLAADGLGNIYAASYLGGLYKIAGIADITPEQVDPAATTVGVAPGTNNAYADRGNEVVAYNSTGARVSAFATEEVSESRGIGINNGETKIYVGTPEKVKVFGAATTVPDAATEDPTGVSKIAATLHGTIGAAGGPEAICFFQYTTEQQYNAHRFQGAIEKPCTPAGPFSGSGETAVTANATGLSKETTYYVRLTGENANGKSYGASLQFVTPGAVNLATAPATAVADDMATLNGTVNPEGTELEECRFEYGVGFPLASSVPCAETPAQIGSGNSPVTVHADLTGLAAGTEYSFRLVGKNEFGTNQGAVETFKTHGPKIEAQSASGVTSTGATLRATINPNGEPTTYHFEYVDDTSFQANGYTGATKVPIPDGPVGVDFEGHDLKAELSGLQASTVYHFRVIANSPDGTATGPDATFTTYPTGGPFPACGNDLLRYGYGGLLPDCRAYEQATPINKNGTNALAAWFSVQAGSNGGAIAFWTPAGMPGGTGAGQLTNYASLRSAAGWSTVGLLPPASLGQFSDTPGWTPDLRYTIDIATDLGAGTGLFIKDNADGSVATMVPYVATNNPRFSYVGASADASKVFFEASDVAALTPETALGHDNLYVWDRGSGDVSLVGVLPASACGSPPCAPAEGSFAGPYDWWENQPTVGGAQGEFFTQAQNTVSNDGSKAYFTASGSGQIYLRKNPTSPAATTVEISASQKTNGSGPGGTDPNGPQLAAFAMATPDGSKAFFTSPEELTNNANTGPADNGRDLYRFDAASGQLTDLAPDTADPNGAEVLGVVGTSDDGSHVYFPANGDLDGAGPAAVGNCSPNGTSFHVWGGECSLYLWHEGQITFVARLDTSGNVSARNGAKSDATNWAPRSVETGGNSTILNTGRVSADGSALLFTSQRKLTSYDSHGTPELYRYDVASASLDCVSCNPSNVAPVGQPGMQAQTSYLGLAAPASITTRNLSSSGDQVFFETKDALLPADTNGLEDVYEWEAEGAGSCQSSAANGGCLYLISTGTSPSPSNIADASASGDEVYFFTEQQLVGQDEDNLVDIYDAHVGGGLASQNPPRPPDCAGEACKGAGTQAPGAKGAGSAAFQGAGNAASQVGCVADPAIKRLTKSAQSLRAKSRKLSRQATGTSDPKQARKLAAKAHNLAKSAQGHEKRAQKLVKRCRGVGGKGAR